MGLQLALKFHTENDLINASLHYKRALDQGVEEIVLFQNYGSLLRSLGKIDEARSVYEQGLKLFPDSLTILNNQANLELKLRPTLALQIYSSIFHLRILQGDDSASLQSALSAIVSCMVELRLTYLPYQLLVKYQEFVEFNSILTLYLIQLLNSPELGSSSVPNIPDIDAISSQIESSIFSYSPASQVELRFALASFFMHKLKHPESVDQYNKGLQVANSSFASLSVEEKAKLEKSFTIHSWNFSNALIKNQNFSQGWSLYDHGLLAPADGPQRWQRALAKPFSHNEVSLWRGESLQDKSILFLEEQGIGDAMQFISLIPRFFSIAKHVGLFVSDRLYELYSHSFKDDISSGTISLYRSDDAIKGDLKAESYNFQIPLGSVCQYLFTHPKDYHPRVPILKSSSNVVASIKNDYLTKFDSVTRVIGISWRGGGRADRIKKKSIEHKLFLNLLNNHPDVVFVSLQYGEDGSTISSWNKLNLNLNLIFDDRFNAITDFNSWINQVAACDAVISVANTTIHGAGGLNIPTHCLLSRHADWRWLNDSKIQRSFWYPSVGISRQDSSTGSWSNALVYTDSWIECGTPMPSGIDHV